MAGAMQLAGRVPNITAHWLWASTAGDPKGMRASARTARKTRARMPTHSRAHVLRAGGHARRRPRANVVRWEEEGPRPAHHAPLLLHGITYCHDSSVPSNDIITNTSCYYQHIAATAL